MSDVYLHPCPACGFALSVAIVRPTTERKMPTELYRKCPLCSCVWYGGSTNGQEEPEASASESSERMVLPLPTSDRASVI